MLENLNSEGYSSRDYTGSVSGRSAPNSRPLSKNARLVKVFVGQSITLPHRKCGTGLKVDSLANMDNYGSAGCRVPGAG